MAVFLGFGTFQERAESIWSSDSRTLIFVELFIHYLSSIFNTDYLVFIFWSNLWPLNSLINQLSNSKLSKPAERQDQRKGQPTFLSERAQDLYRQDSLCHRGTDLHNTMDICVRKEGPSDKALSKAFGCTCGRTFLCRDHLDARNLGRIFPAKTL